MDKTHSGKPVISGESFDRWTVLYRDSGKPQYWVCLCSCGNKVSVFGPNLTNGKSTKCMTCNPPISVRTHLGSGTDIYNIWIKIRSRCRSPKDKAYLHYGGSGINVCQEWYDNFESFRDYVGKRPTPKHSIDRYPNNRGNYEPGNVRWATQKQQTRNQVTNNLYLFDEEYITAAEIGERLGLVDDGLKLFASRITHGWSIDDALDYKLRQARSFKLKCVGENNPNAKLTETDVNAIRKSSERSGVLATGYGVSRETVWAIRAGKTWVARNA